MDDIEQSGDEKRASKIGGWIGEAEIINVFLAYNMDCLRHTWRCYHPSTPSIDWFHEWLCLVHPHLLLPDESSWGRQFDLTRYLVPCKRRRMCLEWNEERSINSYLTYRDMGNWPSPNVSRVEVGRPQRVLTERVWSRTNFLYLCIAKRNQRQRIVSGYPQEKPVVARHPPIHLSIWRSLRLRNVVELMYVLELLTLKEYNERIKNCSERGEEMVECWDAKLSTNDDCCGSVADVVMLISERQSGTLDTPTTIPQKRAEKWLIIERRRIAVRCLCKCPFFSHRCDHCTTTQFLPAILQRSSGPSRTSNITRLLRGPEYNPNVGSSRRKFSWLVKRLLHNFPGCHKT